MDLVHGTLGILGVLKYELKLSCNTLFKHTDGTGSRAEGTV